VRRRFRRRGAAALLRQGLRNLDGGYHHERRSERSGAFSYTEPSLWHDEHR
jgi:hypothetical protein